MTTIVYGIRNCDTIKKTLVWLNEHGVAHQFHDYRRDGIDAAWLALVEQRLGWEIMLNRRGTTWRALADTVKTNISKESALALMLEQPAIIRRPLIAHNDRWLVGFNPDELSSVLL